MVIILEKMVSKFFEGNKLHFFSCKSENILTRMFLHVLLRGDIFKRT